MTVATHRPTARFMPRLVVWRVVQCRRTEDGRWKLVAVSEHAFDDLSGALAVAARWIRYVIGEIERCRLRVDIRLVSPSAAGIPDVPRWRRHTAIGAADGGVCRPIPAPVGLDGTPRPTFPPLRREGVSLLPHTPFTHPTGDDPADSEEEDPRSGDLVHA